MSVVADAVFHNNRWQNHVERGIINIPLMPLEGPKYWGRSGGQTAPLSPSTDSTLARPENGNPGLQLVGGRAAVWDAYGL